jgi:PAS domain S-box-containing protein
VNPSHHEPRLPADVADAPLPGRPARATRPREEPEVADRPADVPARRAPEPEPAPLHDALATLAIGLAVVDAGWTLTYANDALAQLVGRSAAELIGRPLAEVFPTMRGGVEHALVRRTMEDGAPRSFRVERAGRGGVFEVRAAGSAGRQLVLEIRDATAVARLEREHERALESIGEALFVVDTEWRVTYWNAAVERVSGLPRSAALERELWDVWPWLSGTPLERAYREAMASRAPREVPRWSDATLGVGRVFDVRCYPVPENGLLVLISEVSETLRREQALAEASGENAMLRELAGRLADTPDSATLLRVLSDIVCRECRSSGAGVCAVQGDELVVLASNGPGLPPADFVLPLAGTMTEEVVATRRVLRRSRPSSGYAPLRRVLEEGRVAEQMIAPLIAYDQVVGVLVTARQEGLPPFTDRDERRLRLVADHAALALWKSRLLEQAQAANEAKSTFLTTMSHELRTPLTALTGYGELLADEILGPLGEGQHEMVERMCSVTQHLATLIDELLTFSSLEAGRETVRADEVLSGDLLRAAVAVVEPLARQKGLAVEVRVPADAPVVRTDPDKVRQILVNLAGNAVKFTEAGTVSLSVTAGEGEVRFGVRDTGIGIAAEARPRLFQPFTQLESGLTRRYGGSGLGLYISSRLAGLLGGRIELQSAPGKGSLFELVLPNG